MIYSYVTNLLLAMSSSTIFYRFRFLVSRLEEKEGEKTETWLLGSLAGVAVVVVVVVAVACVQRPAD